MKQLIVKCTVLFVLAIGFSQATNAQRIFVDVQPQARAVPRPLAPRSNYVWIEGEWVLRGRHYVYQPGYWAAPRAGWVWMPGRWIRERRGWYWMPGSWRRG